MWKVKVESWDDALVIKFPEDFVTRMDLNEGDEVDFEVEDGALMIIKRPRSEPTRDGS